MFNSDYDPSQFNENEYPKEELIDIIDEKESKNNIELYDYLIFNNNYFHFDFLLEIAEGL